jgi:hypothetical protein
MQLEIGKDRTMNTIAKLEARIAALEKFIVRNSSFWNDDDVDSMLKNDSLQDVLDKTVRDYADPKTYDYDRD